MHAVIHLTKSGANNSLQGVLNSITKINEQLTKQNTK